MPGEKKSLLANYLIAKRDFWDAVVLYQLGGFYQAFYNDALVVTRELGVCLLSRAMGGGVRAPMCGIPAASVMEYAERLAERGYRVAVYTQRRTAEGGCFRELTAVLAPKGGVRDLTSEWEDYFDDPPEVPAPKAKQVAEPTELLERLRDLDLAHMSPMGALQTLHDWQKRYTRRGPDKPNHDGL